MCRDPGCHSDRYGLGAEAANRSKAECIASMRDGCRNVPPFNISTCVPCDLQKANAKTLCRHMDTPARVYTEQAVFMGRILSRRRSSQMGCATEQAGWGANRRIARRKWSAGASARGARGSQDHRGLGSSNDQYDSRPQDRHDSGVGMTTITSCPSRSSRLAPAQSRRLKPRLPTATMPSRSVSVRSRPRT